MPLEAHFDFTVMDKISYLCRPFPEPQLRSLANTLRICQYVWTCRTVSVMFFFFLFFFISFTWFCTFLCLQTSKSPHIWRGHFLLRNACQPVAYYWPDGSSHWQWNKTKTLASPVCEDHKKATLLSFICFWKAIHNFQDSFLLNLFKMSAYWQR